MALFRCDFLSKELGMQTSANVTIPDGGAPVNQKPVVFLLHGLSDNHSNWIRRTAAERYADERDCVLIMPEAQRSFYLDMKYGLNYFSYISKELPLISHKFFNTTLKPEKTYIAGLSMGGYGSMKCGFTYPKRYAAIATFSSACDIERCSQTLFNGGLKKEAVSLFGEELKIPKNCDLKLLAKKADASPIKPRVLMTCGLSDVLLDVNHDLREHLKTLNFDYKYEEWEGGHNWKFWDESLCLAFEFFFGKLK